MVALILSGMAGFYTMVSAKSQASYERRASAIISMIARTNTDDSVMLSEEAKARIRGLIEDAKAGRLKFECIEAFNDYNFCQLSNKLLGNLYKSHGCLHVSPVNVRVLNEVLPVGSKVEIKSYDADYDTEKAKTVPSLISLIQYKTDLKDVKTELSSKTDVKTVIYPGKEAYVIFLQGKPYASLRVSGGTRMNMYMFQRRDERGYPVFDDNLAGPTPTGSLYVFKKVDNYVSDLYREQTTIPMGAVISNLNGEWMFEISKGEWKPVPAGVAKDLQLPVKDRQYVYYEILKDAQGQITQARWASNTFGAYPVLLSRDMRSQAPELIHTTCDLMVDQYSMFSIMINILSKPYDSFDKCVAATYNISDIKGYFNFDRDPSSGGIDKEQSAYYKVYFDLPLLPEESSLLPKDVFIANQIVKKQGTLDSSEEELLVSEGIAARKNGTTVIDMEKIYGLQFYTYQNVVMIKKYANLYSSLRDNWDDLSALRDIIVRDMRNLSIVDPVLYRRFAVELMLKRVAFKRLTLDEVLDELAHTLGL
ncbi:MAG: hypothetical protein WC645_01595 [Candidatus Margulisiibacteriota bacterium]